MSEHTIKAVRPLESFTVEEVARLVFASLLDRFDSVLPPSTSIEEVNPNLLAPWHPYEVPYVWGLVEATLQMLSALTGLCATDVEKVLGLESALREYASRCIAGESNRGRQICAKQLVDVLIDDFLTIC